MENSELNDLFTELANEKPAAQPPVEGTSDISLDAPTIDLNEASSQGRTPDEVKVSDPVAPNEATPSAAGSEDVSWDSLLEDISPEPKTGATPSIDWKEVGKAINTSDIKGPEDLTKYVDSLRKTVEDLKSQPQTFGKDLPKEFLEAAQIAKDGGDYKSFLAIAEIDYKAENPVDLFEDEVANLFYNQDGSFREEEYTEYIDSISLPDKTLRGRQLQRELILVQEQNKNQIKARVAAEKADNLRKLEGALNNFNRVDAFDVTPKVKKQLFNELATGQFLNELGISQDGSHNWDKLLNTYFKARYFDTIQKFNSRAVLVKDKRSQLDEFTNSSITKGQKPENPMSTNKKSGIDFYLDSIK